MNVDVSLLDVLQLPVVREEFSNEFLEPSFVKMS